MINFGGFVPLSTVDFPGHSSSVVFFRGCTFNCPKCYNKIICNGVDMRSVDQVKSLIKESKPLISAVVFSGGEPTEQAYGLAELCKFSKLEGLMVCIHTNGCNNFILDDVDNIVLDIKTPNNFSGVYYSQYIERMKRFIKYARKRGKNVQVTMVVFQNDLRDLKPLQQLINEPIIFVQGIHPNTEPVTLSQLSAVVNGCCFRSEDGTVYVS